MKTRLLLLAAIVLLGQQGAVYAHAMLERAAPAVGSTMYGSPEEVKLRFDQELEPAFSKLSVVDQDGRQVDNKDPSVEPNDRSVLRVSVPKLRPGRYSVRWRVLSLDSHVTSGDYVFVVAP